MKFTTIIYNCLFIAVLYGCSNEGKSDYSGPHEDSSGLLLDSLLKVETVKIIDTNDKEWIPITLPHKYEEVLLVDNSIFSSLAFSDEDTDYWNKFLELDQFSGQVIDTHSVRALYEITLNEMRRVYDPEDLIMLQNSLGEKRVLMPNGWLAVPWNIHFVVGKMEEGNWIFETYSNAKDIFSSKERTIDISKIYTCACYRPYKIEVYYTGGQAFNEVLKIDSPLVVTSGHIPLYSITAINDTTTFNFPFKKLTLHSEYVLTKFPVRNSLFFQENTPEAETVNIYKLDLPSGETTRYTLNIPRYKMHDLFFTSTGFFIGLNIDRTRIPTPIAYYFTAY